MVARCGYSEERRTLFYRRYVLCFFMVYLFLFFNCLLRRLSTDVLETSTWRGLGHIRNFAMLISLYTVFTVYTV